MAAITVIGRAEVSVPPDEARLTLAVESVRPSTTDALEDVAAGLGVSLGAVVEVVETGATRPEPRGGVMRAMSTDVPIEAGEALTASVSVTFQIEQG